MADEEDKVTPTPAKKAASDAANEDHKPDDARAEGKQQSGNILAGVQSGSGDPGDKPSDS